MVLLLPYRDYTEEELSLPYFDEVVEQGDLLYIPRGRLLLLEGDCIV